MWHCKKFSFYLNKVKFGEKNCLIKKNSIKKLKEEIFYIYTKVQCAKREKNVNDNESEQLKNIGIILMQKFNKTLNKILNKKK